ncbi:MAG: PepSY-associated TM helix domain-containing protein [Sphingobium sp.]
MAESGHAPAMKLSRAAFWKGQLRTWHWISSAICMAGLLLFAITGFTLNHAASIEAQPKTVTREAHLSPALIARLAMAKNGVPLSDDMAAGVEKETQVSVAGRDVEVSDGELTVDLAAPGVDSYLTVDLASGDASYERIHRGVIAVLNDLHKGRDSGPVWGWFIDIIAVGCILFSLTGLGLLWIHARGRAWTWPLTTVGFVIPIILFLIFVHS